MGNVFGFWWFLLSKTSFFFRWRPTRRIFSFPTRPDRHVIFLSVQMHLCWSVGFWMMVFSPSMTCCLSWWDSIPLGKSHKKTGRKWTVAIETPLRNTIQALQNLNEMLTFDRWTFERLGYFVPSFCYLGVLRNKKTQYTQIRKLILHYLITKRLR